MKPKQKYGHYPFIASRFSLARSEESFPFLNFLAPLLDSSKFHWTRNLDHYLNLFIFLFSFYQLVPHINWFLLFSPFNSGI
ncbi:unnamed protein product [Meloidogyne enterolobii]|uniref:Uncharacterized protein n=1 Tax=Meloidogyne enterolobii TaxID=390850 RepID=A0ACB1B7Q3_MELEN